MNFSFATSEQFPAGIDFSGATYSSNDDGTIIVSYLVARVKCNEVDFIYPGKFIERDFLPALTIPSNVTASQIPVNISEQATLWLAENYPNT